MKRANLIPLGRVLAEVGRGALGTGAAHGAQPFAVEFDVRIVLRDQGEQAADEIGVHALARLGELPLGVRELLLDTADLPLGLTHRGLQLGQCGSALPAPFLGVGDVAAQALDRDLERTQLGVERLNLLLRVFQRLRREAFALGGGLAAIAGVLVVPIQQAHYLMGHDPLLMSFIVVIIGGLGSLRGTLLAAFAIGISDGVISVFFTPTLAKIVATLLVSLVLVVRPAGLFGEKEP